MSVFQRCSYRFFSCFIIDSNGVGSAESALPLKSIGLLSHGDPCPLDVCHPRQQSRDGVRRSRRLVERSTKVKRESTGDTNRRYMCMYKRVCVCVCTYMWGRMSMYISSSIHMYTMCVACDLIFLTCLKLHVSPCFFTVRIHEPLLKA